MRYKENKNYIQYRKKRDNSAIGVAGFPGAGSTGKAKVSKSWSGSYIPKPKKIEKDGKWVYYEDYLRGEHWHKKRREALNYWGHTCMNCGNNDGPLNVHHTHYNDLWKEDVTDLRIWCRKCHRKAHDVDRMK